MQRPVRRTFRNPGEPAMNGMPVSANTLGLENPQKPLGYSQLALSGGVLLLAIVRAVFLLRTPVSSGDFEIPYVVGWGAVIGAAIAGLGHLAVGIRALLTFVVQAGAPAELNRARATVSQLLSDRTIVDTYERPRSVFQLLLFRLAPRFIYLTPGFRRLVPGLGGGIFVLLLVLLASPLLFAVAGPATTWLLVVLTIASASRLAALSCATPSIPDASFVAEQHHHLTKAGDPHGLFQQAYHAIEKFREGTFRNRTLRKELPRFGTNSQDNQVEGELLIETQPMPLRSPESSPRSALLLEASAVALGMLAWGLLLFSSMVTDLSTRASIMTYLAGGLGLLACWRHFELASGIRNTFLFRSDLYWLRIEGSYTVTKLGPTGGGGTITSERESFMSDLRVVLYGSRIVSECTVPYGSLPKPQDASGLEGEIALCSPRLIVTTCSGEDFRSRLYAVLRTLEDYRDTGGQLRAPDFDENLAQVLNLNAQIHQMQANAQAQALAAHGLAPRVIGPPQTSPTALPGPPSPGKSPGAAASSKPPLPGPVSGNDNCPSCGRKSPGRPGERFCMICDRTF
jgi:hypothetical protein